MKKIISVVAIVLIVALCVGLLGYYTEGFKDWSFSDVLPAEEIQEKIGELEIVAESNEFIDLVVSDYKGPLMASPGGLPSIEHKRLVATVYPENAVHKLVDWTVSWQNPDSEFAAGKDVHEYININVLDETTLIVNVECYQPFVDEVIIVTCTTRDGAISVNCNVVFKGIPKWLRMNLDNITQGSGGGSGHYILGSYSVYDFDLSLGNDFGFVGSEYGDYSVEVVGLWDVVLDVWYSASMNAYWLNEESVVSVDSLKSNFISASIVNGKLHIETLKTIEDYSEKIEVTPSSSKYWKFKSNSASRLGKFSIKVTDNISGKFVEKVFRIEASVESVGLSDGNIEF